MENTLTNDMTPQNGKSPVLKISSDYPIRGARVIPHKAQHKAFEKPVGLGHDMVERMLTHELSRAEQAWKQKLEEARRQSYEEGFANGCKETENKLLGQFKKSNQILKKTAERFHADVNILMQEQEQNILHLIFGIARKVVGLDVSLNPDIVLEVLRQALRLMNEKQVVRIVVNSSDHAHVRDHLEQLRMQFDLPTGVEIVANESLEPGGVRLESEYGSIDADIATQFEEISRRMLKDDSPISD
ncbi:MAG: hypothetical protein K8R90_01575 [Candidatus Cloacimonetes bacterium]|nr:hypothetical protein [Candidatus Cloacimonadota bacterium]